MNAAGRRQKQARNKYRHIDKKRRPKYKVRSVEASQRREAVFRERQKTLQGRKKK